MYFFFTFVPMLAWFVIEYVLNLLVTIISPSFFRSSLYKAIRTYFTAALAAYSLYFAELINHFILSLFRAFLLSFVVGVFLWMHYASAAYRGAKTAKEQGNMSALKNYETEKAFSFAHLFLVPFMFFVPKIIPYFLIDFFEWATGFLVVPFYDPIGSKICIALGIVALIPTTVKILIFLNSSLVSLAAKRAGEK